MTKDKYLEKLAFAKSDIRLLIAETQAGAVKVGLEQANEILVQIYDRIADMNEQQLKLVLC